MGTTPGMNGDYAKALRTIKAKTLIMTGVKDLLNPVTQRGARLK